MENKEKQNVIPQELTDEQLDAVAGGVMVAPFLDNPSFKSFKCRNCGASIKTRSASPQDRCDCGKMDWEYVGRA